MGRGSLGWVLAFTLLIAQGCAQVPQARQHPAQPVVAPPTLSETRALLESNQFAELERRFSAVQRNYKSGSISDEDLRTAFRVFYPTDASLEQKYTAWIAQFPKSYVAHLARAIYYKKVGQERRGTAYVRNTSEKQLHGMEDSFRQASADLLASLDLDDKPLLTYSQQMDIASYLGEDELTRAILDAAIKADRNNIIVREKYMGTLTPRWGGSVEEMQAFLEESRRAGVSIPHLHVLQGVILADQAATENEAGDYAAAERDFRKAVALGNEGCLPCFGTVLAAQGKFTEAIPIYSKALAANPSDIDTLARRGDAYMNTGMMREGLQDLRAAAEGGDAWAQNKLGRYYTLGIPDILPPDMATGLEWFKKSAAQGDPAGRANYERFRQILGNRAGQ